MKSKTIMFLTSMLLLTVLFALTPGGHVASAASRLQAATSHSSGHTSPVQPKTSVINCSGYGCDNVYAYPSNTNSLGSNCGGYFVGWFSGEPRWSKMYYSSSCRTNFAYVTSSPDGYPLVAVLLQRRPPGGSPTGHIYSYDPTYIRACASAVTIPPSDVDTYCDADYIPNGAYSWITNMLYAPVDQVQVCVWTTYSLYHGNYSYCSYWH